MMVNSQANAATVDRADKALVLAVDAGGTKTAAWLAVITQSGAPAILGRGRSTAANPLTVGFHEATRAIIEAVEQARSAAGPPAKQAHRAVLSIAGAADVAIRDQFLDWARAQKLAKRVAVVPDMWPVLAAGADDCCGVALVAGTGSVAFARAPSGETTRCGGWGYLVGDDGSGYAIGRAAVRHALQQLESGRDADPLATRVLQTVNVHTVAAVTAAIYQSAHPRSTIASLAPAVLELAADGDEVALAIVRAAGNDLADLAARAARSVPLVNQPILVAASGGVIVGSQELQDQLRAALKTAHLQCTLQLVDEPEAGCVRLAAHEFAGLELDWR